MCGVFGYVGEGVSDRVKNCARSLTHRGPDAFGEYLEPDGSLYLAHCRLSIIDLSDRSRQPMASENGRMQIVFNGEIYNYQELRKELTALGRRFKTTSDTEVLLHAYEVWGRDCLQRLVGMFAFGIWDRDLRRLFLARDRMGIKPLYILRGDGFFAFASEAKALLNLPGYSRSIDPHGLVTYLLYSYVIGRKSIWQNMERLPPGQWLELDVDSREEDGGVYWQIEPANKPCSMTDGLDRFDELLNIVVSDHQIADVPVGVLLSGGLDSGLIAAHLGKANSGTESYTMGFAGFEEDERENAKAIANHVGLPNTAFTLDEQDFVDVRHTLDMFDEPLGDTSIFPTEYVCRMARRYVKVGLSGDGGDELFGGYQWYLQLEANPIRRNLAFFVETMRRALGVGRPWPEGCGNRFEYQRMLTSASFSVDEIIELFPWVDRALCMGVQEEMSRKFDPAGGKYKRWQLLDAGTYLVDNNLTRVDRASMAHGLEVRVPFVDHRLVEFAFSLPDNLCVNGNETKKLVRASARRVLPEKAASRRKQGFSYPLHRLWPLHRMVDSIRKGALMQEGIVSSAAVYRLLNEMRTDNRTVQIWLLAVLEYWCRRWWR